MPDHLYLALLWMLSLGVIFGLAGWLAEVIERRTRL